MIAPMTPLESDENTGGVADEPLQNDTRAGRRRSWEQRGRSQVVFNGPPVDSSDNCANQRSNGPAAKRSDRSVIREMSGVPA